MRRFLSLFKKPEIVFWLVMLIALAGSIAVLGIVYWHPEKLQLIRDTSAWYAWLSGSVAAGIALAVIEIFLFFGAHAEGKHSFNKELQNAQGDDVKMSPKEEITPVSAVMTISQQIRTHLRRRYTLYWRRKTRLLLITGDEAAIEQLAPGLKESQWLEGNRTVLIFGGSLKEEPDSEKYTALRKLRRGRPLDGIVRVMPESLNLTPQISDNDLRGLEKISELLRYSAPVWLWQLCSSDWSQSKRPEQAVGASFPLRAKADDISRQLEQMLPALRAQGVDQVIENNSHDFLLRLGQHLSDGGIARWAQQLVPWLSVTQQRVPLRGLMFSLPENKPAGISENGVAFNPTSADTERFRAESQRHALTLPVIWQGIVDDCTRIRGRRVGIAWEQTLAWTLMIIIGVWGAGTLLSFAVNRLQIVAVAEQAHALVEHPSVSDYQLTALHNLRNDAGRLQHRIQEGAPWYQRFGLDHNPQLLAAMLPWYGVANNRLIRDPAAAALTQKLSVLANSAPGSDQRAQLAKPGYDQLKAWLMMARPDKADGPFYAQTMKAVQPTHMGISTGLWQSLSPDLWAFYITELPRQPQWKIVPDASLLSQSRQVLLAQIGRRNAESTLYENMLKSVRRNFADISLEDMTSGTDARRLFTTDEVVPGMFTRQAWQGGIQQAIEKAANSRRDEIDWVLSDSGKAVSADLSPEALKARLTQRYFADFAGNWLSFLNSLHWNPAHNIADVTDQLTLMSDVRQSPLIALMNTLAWQGQTGEQRAGLSDSIIKSAKELVGSQEKPVIDQSAAGPQGPLDDTFGPLLALMGKNKASNVMSADSTLSLQTWLTRITRVRLRLQQVANSSDPQESMQTLAQTVFQGKSVDLTDTQQYGSLVAASLGEEWSGFGNTMFVQPLTQAWETVLQPSAASLNDRWSRSVVANWHTAFDGRFPFAMSKSDASLPMLAEFIRKDSGRIDRFLSTQLNGVLHKEGSQWVPDNSHSQGLTFNPAFLRAVNQLSQLSDILFTDGSQGISFELQPRPAAEVTETQLTIDGQKLHYFNQMADWQSLRWPGDTFRPGTMLTWTTVNAGARLFGDYSGTWGFIRWLDQSKRRQLDRSQWMLSFSASDGRTLQWVLRSQLGNGPLALLSLRNFSLPDQIFSLDTPVTSQAPVDTDYSAMEGVE
ncbi:type VI secretion protein VasK [Pantoea agglomerans]|uniref:ImcF-related family protein n=1 Tax=Pantoea TaxID=53335 RepID=UPI001F376DCD|nr:MULTISPECIES: ImcF-related family protein [Pantoea]UIL50975.1 type VI secretion protein VasK [Pantoea agglomerans]